MFISVRRLRLGVNGHYPGIQGFKINEDAQLELCIQIAKQEFWEEQRAVSAFFGMIGVVAQEAVRRQGARKAPIHVDKEKVHDLRLAGGTLKQIGALLGVSYGTVYRFLNGYTCRCADCT